MTTHRSLPLQGRIHDPGTPAPFPVLAKGFRPFFLLAALFAAMMVPAWLFVLAGATTAPGRFDPVTWHAHEMIFGFVTAVIAGFLLTAVGNWTGRETAVGWPLAGLAALWVAGRIAMGFSGWVPFVIDAAFLPALAITIGRPLLATGNRRNFVMLAVLAALFAANVAIHLGAGRRAWMAAIDIVVLLVLVIGGRVIPMFTKNATRVDTIRSSRPLDVFAIASMALVVVLDAAAVGGTATAAACLLAAVAATARAAHWGSRHAMRVPLLAVLHVGYAWIPIGLFLRAWSAWDPSVPAAVGMHALTVGAIGSVILGMMARVALGHTGRTLEAPRAMTVAFGLLTVSAVVRVAAPLAWPARYAEALQIAGIAWTIAFLLYVVVYAPLLLRPRADGKPG